MYESVEFGRLAVIVGTALAFGLLDLTLGTGWWTMVLWVAAAWPALAIESARSSSAAAVGQCEAALLQVAADSDRLRTEIKAAEDQRMQALGARQAAVRQLNEELAGDRIQARVVAHLAKSPALEQDFPKHVSDLRSAVGEARDSESFLRSATTGGELHAARVAALIHHVETFLAAVDVKD
ncbi:MAG: hypothetical protein AB7Q42_06190 [Acidimicrobiia bacterium]